VTVAQSLDERDGSVARQILAYFVQHSGTADSLEGIARWRLLEVVVQRSLAETEGALRELVAEGYLYEKAVPGSASIFLLNQAKAAEAEQLVASASPGKTRDSAGIQRH
jgi:hypothetical protein